MAYIILNLTQWIGVNCVFLGRSWIVLPMETICYVPMIVGPMFNPNVSSEINGFLSLLTGMLVW